MKVVKLFDAEFRFMTIVWEYEPVKSTDLVTLASEKLGWKKSTTYTVIRKLGECGVLNNENTIVVSLFSKEKILTLESQVFLNRFYGGSLHIFLDSFLK